MTKRVYPTGIDSVWIAKDRNGHLGAFVTGGVGPIPIHALNNEYLAVEDVEDAVCQLPLVSETHLLATMKRPDAFVAMAKRGIFVYDWRDVHRTEREYTRTYELIAIPLKPIQDSELPDLLAHVVDNILFGSLAFAQEHSINVNTQLECCSGTKE
jgi:hypothetical protein